MRCGRVRKIGPRCVVIESQYHNGLHDQNDDESESHTKRYIFLGIFHLTGDRDCKFSTDKKPECNGCHGDDLCRACCHIGRLRDNLSGSELKHTNESHNDHRSNQQEGYKILQLCKHINAFQVGDHNDRHHDRGIHNTWNRQWDNLRHCICKNGCFDTCR